MLDSVLNNIQGDKNMVYFDNAATSFPKPDIVYNEVLKCMKEYCANPGRGGHQMSINSGKAVVEAREVISNFFNMNNPMQVCFTKNATEGLNYALYGLLEDGDNVITSPMEHNSVMRPLKTICQHKEVSITILKGNKYGEIGVDEFAEAIKPNTKLVVLTLSSNVNGIIMPFKEIGRICRQKGILFLLDGSQGAGSINIDVQEAAIDLLALPGHKGLMGPQGTGILYVREGIGLKPMLQGGTGSNSENILQPEIFPDAMESGTLNTPGIVGLGAGIKFISGTGIEKIREHKNMLVESFYNGVKNIQGIKIYSKNELSKNSGIIALNVDGMESTEVSYILDKKYGIETRAGLHCAPMAHTTLGTLKTGVVRFSFSYFNQFKEIEYTVSALEKISKGN